MLTSRVTNLQAAEIDGTFTDEACLPAINENTRIGEFVVKGPKNAILAYTPN